MEAIGLNIRVYRTGDPEKGFAEAHLNATVFRWGDNLIVKFRELASTFGHQDVEPLFEDQVVSFKQELRLEKMVDEIWEEDIDRRGINWPEVDTVALEAWVQEKIPEAYGKGLEVTVFNLRKLQQG